MSAYVRMWWSQEQHEWIVKLYVAGARFRTSFSGMDSGQEALECCQGLLSVLRTCEVAP